MVSHWQEQLSKLSPVKDGCISVKDCHEFDGLISPQIVTKEVFQKWLRYHKVMVQPIVSPWHPFVERDEFFWLFRTCPPVSAAKMEVAMRRGDIPHTRQGLRRAVATGWNIYFMDLSKRKPFTWKYVKFKKCWELQFNLHEVSIHPPPGSGSSSVLEPGI